MKLPLRTRKSSERQPQVSRSAPVSLSLVSPYVTRGLFHIRAQELKHSLGHDVIFSLTNPHLAILSQSPSWLPQAVTGGRDGVGRPTGRAGRKPDCVLGYR